MKIILSLSLVFPMFAFADVPTEQKLEVDHLIAFVTDSSCQFKRNFSYHTGKDAADHINKKYNHFKNEIETTEDFIRLSATKSLLTSKVYKIKCGDDGLLEISVWLQAELETFRNLPEVQAVVNVPDPEKEPAS